MSNVVVQKICESNQFRPLLQETVDLLDRVEKCAFELFEKRRGAPGNDMADWLQAEKEVFRVSDTKLAESENEFQLQLAPPGFDAKDVRVLALPQAVTVEGEATHQHRHTDRTVHFCELGERRAFRLIPLPKLAICRFDSRAEGSGNRRYRPDAWIGGVGR